jgi:hypothetical protein
LHEHALDLARQIGSSWDEAHAIFERIGTAEATDVAAELEDLTSRARLLRW